MHRTCLRTPWMVNGRSEGRKGWLRKRINRKPCLDMATWVLFPEACRKVIQLLNSGCRSLIYQTIRQQNQSLQFLDRSFGQAGCWVAWGHDGRSLSSGCGLAHEEASRNSIDMCFRQKPLIYLHNLEVHHQGLVPVLYRLLLYDFLPNQYRSHLL